MTAVIALVAVPGCARAGGQPFQPTLNTAIVLDDGDRIGQTVNPAGPVSAVDLNVATFDAPADPDGVLTVTIRDVADDRTGGVVSSAEIRGAELADGTWVAAAFDPPVEVADVALVEATWEGATPLALWANTTQDGTAAITNDPYSGGQLVIDGRPVDGDLAFRVVGPGGVRPAAAQVAEVARSTAARTAADPVFAVAWLLALAGGVVLAVRGLWRR